jgi:transposase
MRYELTDFEWAAIKPMLPNKPRGVPRMDDRRVLNGIFWVLDLERRGATYRRASAPIPPATIALFAGVGLASGDASWKQLLQLMMRPCK